MKMRTLRKDKEKVFHQEDDIQGEVCTFFTVLFVVFISCAAEIFKQ